MKATTTNSFHAWVLAARSKTLTGVIISVLIGSTLAFADGRSDLTSALLCALLARGMQITTNFINDLYDYLKGSDHTDRLGSERACARGQITLITAKRSIMEMLAFSCLIGRTLLRQCWEQPPHGDWELMLPGLFCVIFAFLYATVLSYRGWGGLPILVFFGLISVGGVYYVQAHIITTDMWIASLICGLAIDTLLVVNNYRDRKQDAFSGRCTLVVCFGEPFGRYLYLGSGVSAVLLSLWFAHAGKIEPLTFIWVPYVYLYLHVLTWRKMAAIRSGRKLNSILGEIPHNMLSFGFLLSAALVQA